nr:hypothetical protein [Porphyromonas gingivalis]
MHKATASEYSYRCGCLHKSDQDRVAFFSTRHTKLFLLYAPKNVGRENFRFGPGSKKFSLQNEKILTPHFQKTRATIRPFLVRISAAGRL